MSLWLLLLLLGVVVFAWFALRRPARVAGRAVAEEPLTNGLVDRAVTPVQSARQGVVVQAVQAELPEVLRTFGWVAAEALTPQRRQELLVRLEAIPRPPHALHRLLSHEFLASATSVELGEVIKGEPLIAAKVLAAVNSPQYGLQKTVASIGQAVTFLGLNTVRGLCLQYMLDASFKAKSPEQQRVFDRLWQTSAVASQTCARLVQQLGWADQGVLVTQVVLYFLGQLAVAALLPESVAVALRAQGLTERLQSEQMHLGVSAAEIGALLMRAWGLPETVIADVRDIDRVMDRPAEMFDGLRGPRLALCYLCARLAEDEAAGLYETDLQGLLSAGRPEFFHFAGHLNNPALARLPQVALVSREREA